MNELRQIYHQFIKALTLTIDTDYTQRKYTSQTSTIYK